MVIYSQSLLSKYEHEKVNQIGRDQVEKKYEEGVNEFARSDVAIGVPNGTLEGIIVGDFPPLFQHLAPRYRHDTALRYVVNRYAL